MSSSAAIWNPKEQPFVVGRAYRTNARGLCGWHETRTVYATEAEARAAYDAPFKAGEIDATLWDASAHPKWKRLAHRKRRDETKP